MAESAHSVVPSPPPTGPSPTGPRRTRIRRLSAVLGVALSLTLVAAACGDTSSSAGDAGSSSTALAEATVASPGGLVTVSPLEARAVIDDPPAGLVVLDVRTPEEFAEGHIENAVMLDFYRDDFADRLAELDPTTPYVLYCRSGNRSGRTLQMMADLGFDTVYNVDGGIISWLDAGLPVVTG